MKSGLKVFLSAIVPMAALVTTSCGKNKKISYNEAIQYAMDHFDNNSLDTFIVDYTAHIDRIGADITISILDDIGMTSDIHFAAGIGNIEAVARGFYGYCMSTRVINTVQSNYATISSLVMESFTKIPVEVSYELVNGGMKASLGTSNASNNILDLVRLTAAILNALSYLPHTDRENFIKGIQFLSPDAVKTLMTITDVMNKGLTISVDPSSSSMNDNFNAYVGCESHGYINSAGLSLNGEFNIGILLATTEAFDIEFPQYTSLAGRYSLSGSIGIDVSVTAEFVK